MEKPQSHKGSTRLQFRNKLANLCTDPLVAFVSMS